VWPLHAFVIAGLVVESTGRPAQAQPAKAAAQQPTDPHAACVEDSSGHPAVAVFAFTPAVFAFRYAGDLKSEGLPFTWTINGRFLFLNYSGTVFPWIGIWYLYDGQLKDANDSIKLTDDATHEYPLQTHPIPGASSAGAPPRGCFT